MQLIPTEVHRQELHPLISCCCSCSTRGAFLALRLASHHTHALEEKDGDDRAPNSHQQAADPGAIWPTRCALSALGVLCCCLLEGPAAAKAGRTASALTLAQHEQPVHSLHQQHCSMLVAHEISTPLRALHS